MESEGAEVRRGLYIGSLAAASDEEWLAARGITHILTVAWGIAPFWPEWRVVSAEDEDLLQHLAACHNFIDGGIRAGASPNPGFRRQLTVYHQMLVRQRRKAARDSQNQSQNQESETESATDADVAAAEDLTKHYRAEKLRMVMNESGELPAHYFAAIRRPTQQRCFSCYKCRQPLFSAANVLHHATGEDVYRVFVENTNYRRANKKGRGAPSNDAAAAVGSAFVGRSSAPCASVFVEPMAWMLESLGADELKKSEGTFYCPKCKSRIGSWNWQGSRCACGGHAIPAFLITKNRVC
ncbi:dual specificity phosphatase 12, putative [Acanthamoeba castellanii str. Neff]|uniref:protein-tyrosine-phosphatase n=1 Tax=Acanthamoeba castellanii (strain ATCC 30010 / Neff) TaxID=1257118 RepID=L8GZG4_ACACF|nr:dual specificity phosphatase 12, putative [Acanthamoeba castellanii str. Neff]ELR18609.1 dual specificity phosphatase 12, putative [Acanthamoeba castellanii str. Neff]